MEGRAGCLGVLVGAVIGLMPGWAQAGTARNSFNVTVTVISDCRVAAADLDFGTYDPQASTPRRFNTTLAVSCTRNTPYTVALSAGSSADYAQRVVTDGSGVLRYNLYTDSNFTKIWGDGSSGTQIVSGSGRGPGAPSMKTIYGLLPAAQNVEAGRYQDTITVIISY